MDHQDGTNQHIWLRYATEYSKDGRKHTIEMGIPVPLGASAETREKLLREAETGMNQLVQHVEERVFQALERVQSTDTTNNQGATTPIPLILPSAPTLKVAQTPALASAYSTAQSTQATPDESPPVKGRSSNKQPSFSAPQTATQAPNPPRTPSRPPAPPVEIPPTRDSVSASMPTSLGPTTAGGNLSIPEFISYIGKNLQLSPKQAMELLRVKTLSGINLREALEKLKQIVAQNTQSETTTPQRQASTVREARPVVSTPVSHNMPASLPSQSTASMGPEPAIDELPTRLVHEALNDPNEEHTLTAIEMSAPQLVQSARGFDEEDDLEDLEEPDDFTPSSKFSSDQLDRAREKIIELRAIQGAITADPARLRALRNVTNAEVSDEQLLEIVAGVWSISSLKKLKVDQVGALISWANQDYFLDEVEVVLNVLEEERYARGNR